MRDELYLAVIGLTLFLMIYSVYTEKKCFNPVFLFSLLWLIVVFLSSLNLFNLIKATSESYLIIYVGVLSFCLGFYLFLGIYRDDTRKGITSELIFPIFAILSLITIAFYIKDFFTVLPTLSSGGSMYDIRTMAQDSTSALYVGRSNLEDAFRMLIVEPFALSVPALLAAFIVFRESHWVVATALGVVIIFLRVMTDGSRSLLLYLLMNLVIIYLVRYRANIGKIFLALLPFLLLLVSLSISRLGSQSLGENLYYYYAMEPTMLDIWKTPIDKNGLYGYGTASFNGFVYLLIYIIKNLLGVEYPDYWYQNVFLLINDTDQQWQTIATDGTQANAYVSLFWFPYLDGGFPGLILIMALYGFLGAYLYKKASSMDIRFVCLYSFYLQGLLMSFVRFQFANVSYALAFVLIALIFKNTARNCC